MSKKRRRGSLFDALNLDSLMDILTCTVGMMLFIIIFAVIEARGVRIKLFTPLAREAPEGVERKVILCHHGTVRLFDFDGAIEQLVGDREVTYYSIPSIVEKAKTKNITDGYFNYKFEWDEEENWSFFGSTSRRYFIITAEEIEGQQGEGLPQLKRAENRFSQLLQSIDKDKYWVGFLVDEESLEVFRKAREICISQGFDTGWDPGKLDFPFRQELGGGGGKLGDIQ